MSFTIETRNQSYLIFNAVEGASCDFAEKLLTLGVDRVVGRVLAMEWASEKYGTRIVVGQRGAALPAGSAAQKAHSRVCLFVWPAESATAKKAKRGQTDPVEKLLAAYGKLTAGQKRSFKAGI
jgi:hypothetical protein